MKSKNKADAAPAQVGRPQHWCKDCGKIYPAAIGEDGRCPDCAEKYYAGHEEREANARLIAAAPELLATLMEIDQLSCNVPIMSREVAEAFSLRPNLDQYRTDVNKIILAMRTQARAALAKVEGRKV